MQSLMKYNFITIFILMTIIGGAVATVFATPIVGATTVSTGIGGAYLMHEKCSATSARVYRQCMGYSK